MCLEMAIKSIRNEWKENKYILMFKQGGNKRVYKNRRRAFTKLKDAFTKMGYSRKKERIYRGKNKMQYCLQRYFTYFFIKNTSVQYKASSLSVSPPCILKKHKGKQKTSRKCLYIFLTATKVVALICNLFQAINSANFMRHAKVYG